MLISVVIPVYNGEKVIKRCLDSLVNQSFKNFEVILIDDASQDKSFDIARQYKELLNLTIIRFEVNRRAGVSRNTGVNNANGEYIFFLDQDDWLDNSCFESLVYCNQDKKYDVVACDILDGGGG